MSRSRQTVAAELTRPGAPFEVVTEVVGGIETPVYRHAAPNLRAVFESTAQHGSKPFLVYRDTRWTFDDHAARVRALAGHLVHALEVAPGERVAIGMRNYPEWLVSYWAIQCIGAVAVPLNAWWTGEELEYAVVDAGCVVAIVDDERLARLAGRLEGRVRATLVARAGVGTALAGGAVPLEPVIEVDDPPAALPAVAIAPDDPSTIMYTSGTTGLPKGAVQTHRNHCTNLMNATLSAAVSKELAAADGPAAGQPVSLQTFPFFHIGGLTGLITSTAFGSKLVLMYKWDAPEAVELIQDEGVTSVAGVPTVVRQLLDELDRQGLPAERLGAVASGGAPVPPHLIERLGERSGRQVRPSNGYGLTETTSAVVSNAGEEYYTHPDSVGRPVPVAEVSIRDEHGEPVVAGETGEVWVRGANIVAGYWNNPVATAEAFTDGWFHTGDAGYLQDGFVYVVDRLKDVVLRGGENVYCAEVEAVLGALPGVRDAAVVGIPHDVLGEEVAAVLELETDASLRAAEVQRLASQRLARFKVPSAVFVTTATLPRTATGKLLKRDLRAALAGAPAGDLHRLD